MRELFLFAGMLVTFHASTGFMNIVTNGDFETGSLNGWTSSGSVSATSESTYHASGGINSFPCGTFAANFGGADQPATGVISQVLKTTVGDAYILSFSHGAFGTLPKGTPANPQSLLVTVVNVSDSQTLFSTTVTDTSESLNLASLLNSYEFAFIATGTTSRITFSDTSPATFSADGVLDNVNVSLDTGFILGDVNLDGVVDLLDVEPFVNLLISGDYQIEADVNMDGVVDLLDVQPFVGLLICDL